MTLWMKPDDVLGVLFVDCLLDACFLLCLFIGSGVGAKKVSKMDFIFDGTERLAAIWQIL